MGVPKHAPLDDSPQPFTPAVAAWWRDDWTPPLGSLCNNGLRHARIEVLTSVASNTRATRGTWAAASIARAFVDPENNKGLWDAETRALLHAIHLYDPAFFETYPRNPGTVLNYDYLKGVIGRAMSVTYFAGRSRYGKPGLRKNHDGED